MANSDLDPDVPLRPLTPFQQGMIAFASVAMGAGMTINFVVVAPLARKAGLTELQVAGIIRPEDITSDNTVGYDEMAEARIAYGGRGQRSDLQQQRYGAQALEILMPF